MGRRPPLLVLVTLLAGCALPDRDNPNDPKNLPVLPVARARLFDYTGPAGECSLVGDTTQGLEQWPGVVAVSRGHCLAVDASESEDLVDAGLSYVFAIDTGSGPTRATTPGGDLFVLDSTLRRELPPEIELQIVVTVEDGAGSTDEARVTLVLLNERPVAIADATRFLPVAGFPWSGTAHTVTFDPGRSFDPDGDELRYCWTFPEVGAEPAVCPTDASDPSFTRQLPLVEGRYAARLVVSDGAARSREVWSEVVLGDLPMWMTDEGTVERVEDVAPYASFVHDDGLRLVDTGTGVGLLGADNNDLRLAPYPSATPLPALFAIPGGDTVGIASNDAGAIAVLRKISPTRFYNVYRYTANPASAGGVVPFLVSPIDPPDRLCQDTGDGSGSVDEAITEPGIAVAPDGTLWMASRRFHDLRTLDLLGTETVVVQGVDPPFSLNTCVSGEFDDQGFAGPAIRPGTSDVWVAEIPFAPGAPPPRLFVYSATTATPDEEYPLPHVVSALAWGGADELWVLSISQGLFHIDVPILEATGSFEAATFESFPDFIGVTRLLIDPVTGNPVGVDNGNLRVITIGVGRDVVESPIAEPVDVRFIDPDGFAWHNSETQVANRRTHSYRADGRALSVVVPKDSGTATDLGVDQGVIDPSSGLLWTSVTLGIVAGEPPYALARIGPDGRFDRLIETIESSDGTLQNVPSVNGVRVSPDGSSLFVASGANALSPVRQVVKLDLTSDSARVLALTTSAEVVNAILDYSGNGSMTFEPTAPSGARLWSYRRTPAFEVFPIDGATLAPQAAVFTVPVAEAGTEATNELPKGAVMPASNRFCFLTRDVNPNGIFRTRYLSLDGTAPLALPNIGTTGFVSEGDSFVATWGDAAGVEGCWVAVMTDDNPFTFLVVSFNAAGGVVGAQSFTGAAGNVLQSLHPLSATEAWISLLTPTNTYVRRRVTFPANADPDVLVRPTGLGPQPRFRSPFQSRSP